MILELRYLGDPILRRETRPVERFDDELARFAADLLETMYHHEGVGLAAPQVGDERRMTVIDTSETRDGTAALVLVNPRVVVQDGTVPSEEGCLSIPGVVETIERAARVEVAYRDVTGERRTVVGEELLGRALQHEIDHLDGVLFIDYLGPLKRRMVVRQWKKTMEEQGLQVP